jgi:PAS domain S-box-containing protein/putative nucleotidyltransferase with HDIG domain
VRQAKVFVVEDETIISMGIQNVLDKFGYSVLGTATTGEEAIEKITKNQPDLVLMDIMLKGRLNGIEASRLLISRMNIPIIFLTSYSDDDMIKQAREIGAYGYILKPINERELYSSIEIALYKNEIDRKLNDKEKFVSSILENIADGIISINNDYRIEFINDSAQKLTGWASDETLNENLFDVFNIVELKENVVRRKEIADFFSDDTKKFDVTLLRKNKEEIIIECTIVPIKNYKNEIKGNIISFNNISDRKKAELELKKNVRVLRKTLKGTVNALATLSEKRDPYTADHQRQVTRLACQIARHMKLPSKDIESIFVAGILHDIGKIYIPAEILNRPGKLSDAEMTIMRTHSQVGYEIVNEIEFPWDISRIILQHHERMDGTGYPNGLKAGEILLEAKIIAVSDVVQAISSHRPYRPALGIETALNEIISNKGTLYDEEVVDVCVKIIKEKGFVFK